MPGFQVVRLMTVRQRTVPLSTAVKPSQVSAHLTARLIN